MSSSDKKVEKMRTLLRQSQKRGFVKDGDLQFQLAHTKELNESDANFREIYSHYIKEPAPSPKESHHVHEKSEQAMTEMKDAFEEMMEINKQLREGWQDLIQMQSSHK